MNYKILIVIVIIIVLIILFRNFDSKIYDWAQIHSASPLLIIHPTSIYEIQYAILKYHNLPICIAGQKFSHGGQTMSDASIQFDMSNFNKIINLDTRNNLITIESGCTWNQIQIFLDRENLSVAEMQSYRNFSVGGSICVNCHGRGMQYGTIADTIHSLKVITSNGKIYLTSATKYSDLFKAVIGSYGGIALILECTLKVEPNFIIEQKVIKTSRSDIIKTINQIKSDSDIVFYNANIYPKNENTVVHISWNKTNKSLTLDTRLQPEQKYYNWKSMGLEQLVRRFDIFKWIRASKEPDSLIANPQVVWKNYEMSYDTNSLNTLFKYPTTSILQEYFIPVNYIENFLDDFWIVINYYRVNLLNVSLRYVYATNIPILNYAPVDRIAIVLYLNIGNSNTSLSYAKQWTSILIDISLIYSGSFYLPYLLFASIDQFRKAYPNYKTYVNIKNKYDPLNRFTNHLIDKYIIQI